jgi:serine/threonine-protein kinase
MCRAIRPAVAILPFAAALLAAHAAFADYGAIAYDTKTGRHGASWHQATPERAAEVALSECAATGCKVLIKIGARRCGALATTTDGKGWGAAGRDGSDKARLAALADCQKVKLGECVVRVTDCNK